MIQMAKVMILEQWTAVERKGDEGGIEFIAPDEHRTAQRSLP